MKQSAALSLLEYEPHDLAIDRRAVEALKASFLDKIDVAPTERAGVYRLTSNGYVGRLTLPGPLTLHIRPRTGAGTLFYMLCSEPGLAHFYPPHVSLSDETDISSFIISTMVAQTEALLRDGMYLAYVSLQQELGLVRGRILLGRQLAELGGLSHRHICEYGELTEDVTENRVVATTLHLALRMGALQEDSGLLKRLRALVLRTRSITLYRDPHQALQALSIANLHRLNARYAPTLALCRLLLSGMTLAETEGSHPFASFLINMPRLFESFLTTQLCSYLEPYGLRIVAQKSDYLDEERSVGIRPDILIYRAASGRATPLLVLDAKYKVLSGSEASNSQDLYQISAYMGRFGVDHGMLVYPQFVGPVDKSLQLKGAAKSIRIVTLDISSGAPTDLQGRCAQLAQLVAELALSRKAGLEMAPML